MKKILKYLLIGGSLFLYFKKIVYANSEFQLENDPTNLTYKIETNERTKRLYFMLVKEKQTQDLVYCLEPGVNLSNESYEELKEWDYQKLNLTENQKDFITKVAYFGYHYPEHQQLSYYYAAQLLIWENIIPSEWKIYYTDSLDGQKVELFQKEREEILNLINLDETLPDFANKTITWNNNETLKLEDTSNQLSKFRHQSVKDWNIEQEQNQLWIKTTSKETITLEFEKTYEGEDLKFYYREDGQNILKRGKLKNQQFSLKLIPYHLQIQVKKIDESQKPIQDVEFQMIAKEDIKNYQNKIKIPKGEVIATLKTDNQGIAVLDGLEQGSYCLKEIFAPKEYQQITQPICFELKKEIMNKTITVTNYKKTQNLIFYKQDADTEKPIEKVHFQVTNEIGKIVFDGFTDSFGKIEIKNLPIGKYDILEIEAAHGYIREPIPTEVELTGEETETTLILRNHKKMQKIIIQKEDQETKERLKGVKFLITNETGKVIFQGETNEEGIIELSGLAYGTYKITELESIEGYLLEKNPVTFVIDETTTEKKITLTNRKLTNVPETYETIPFPKIEYIPRKRWNV